MKKLHLVLKHCWYDKIANGEKTSEYRECKPYWNKRLEPYSEHCFYGEELNVIFHRGYTDETMELKIKDVDITHTTNDLNLPKCWEIQLGKRIL